MFHPNSSSLMDKVHGHKSSNPTNIRFRAAHIPHFVRIYHFYQKNSNLSEIRQMKIFFIKNQLLMGLDLGDGQNA